MSSPARATSLRSSSPPGLAACCADADLVSSLLQQRCSNPVGLGSSHSHPRFWPLALRVCREPAELCESLLWIRSDRVVRIHVGGANLPLPVDDVPGR